MGAGTLLLAAAAIVCVLEPVSFRFQYFLVVGLVVAWMAVIGKAFNGRWEGLLIDGRNRISLSRLQLFVWLVIAGCAFAVEVAHNFVAGAADPDGVAVPAQLGLVMGIATTSFVASPAILNLKTRSAPSAMEFANAHRFARDGSSIHPNSGRLYSRAPDARARWSDLFRGEELETAGSADPAKIQQFLVTFMLSTIYLAALWRDLNVTALRTTFSALPGLSDGGLILLGVSHAAYLGGKAAPQTPAGPASGPEAEMPHIDTAPQPLRPTGPRSGGPGPRNG